MKHLVKIPLYNTALLFACVLSCTACGIDPDEEREDITPTTSPTHSNSAPQGHTSDGCTTSPHTSATTSSPQTRVEPAFVADACDPNDIQGCCPDGMFAKLYQHTQQDDSCFTWVVICTPTETCGAAQTDFIGPDEDCMRAPDTCAPLPEYRRLRDNRCAENLCNTPEQ